MKKLAMKKILPALFTLMVFTGAGCAMASDNDLIRYKVTVTVTTPEGEKSGYAVREAARHFERSVLPEQGGTMFDFPKGEAVVVGLGKHGVLFALPGNQKETEMIFDMFEQKEKRAQTVLASGMYPIFARFRDLADPKSIESVCNEIDLGKIKKDHPRRLPLVDFQSAFGKGVSVKSVSIEITSDNITRGIENFLPWLPQYYNKMLDGQRFNSINSNFPFANSLTAGSFSTEVHSE